MRSRTAKRLTPDAEKLVGHALALAASGSRIEDRFWEAQLSTFLARVLRTGNQPAIDAALDHLQANHSEAYSTLADLIESQSESAEPKTDGEVWEGLLIVIPILAWTRYAIPSGPVKSDALMPVRAHLHTHVLAESARVAISPHLYSIEQLPRAHCESWKVTQQLAQAAVSNAEVKQPRSDLPETAAQILADPRFLLAAVTVPKGTPMFRWQEDGARHAERGQCQEAWSAQSGPNLSALLPGCEIECLLPDAYYASCREADERIRPHTIRTALRYLEDVLTLTPSELRAVVAGFGEKNIDEYRIGFTQRGSNDVIYGVVWPLYGCENAEVEGGALDEVTDLLKVCGVTDIRKHLRQFDPEYCDDCGMPFYPDPLGEVVHAEMPEDTKPSRPHFH